MRSEIPVDLAVARLAATQNRIVTWPQLLAAGMGRRAVAHRVATGRLHRVHRGVYLLEPPEAASRIALLAAAVAACGEGAVLSHRSAAELWALAPPAPGCVEVTVIGRNPGQRPGIRRHRVTSLDRRDVRMRHGIRVSAPARALLELSPWLRRDELESLLARARVERLLTDRDLAATLGRYPNCPGVAALRELAERDGGPSLTRSQAERRLLDLIRQGGLPPPATNVRSGRYELDFLWRDVGLVVEVDGYAFHGDRAAFERDRRRDAALVAGGLRVMRFTWRQIVEEPLVVAVRLAQLLGPSARPPS